MAKPICLSIAGSDSGAGAGIQADIKTFFDLNCYATTVITAITAQNTQEVIAIDAVSDDLFEKQLQSIEDDLLPKAIKTGMIATVKQVEIVSNFLERYDDIFYICDPVMIATSGAKLVNEAVIDAITTKLFPKADLITPNLDEAAYLLLLDKQDYNLNASLEEIAIKLYQNYQLKAVLLKGGHSTRAEVDYFYSQNTHFYLSSKRCLWHQSIHGTGCTLAASITALLALDYDLFNAVVVAKAYITEGIFNAQAVAKNKVNLPVAQCGFPINKNYFPVVTQHQKLIKKNNAFKRLDQSIGFYPVVDTIKWLEYLAKKGIKTIQLRIKDKPLDWVEKAVIQAVDLQKKYHLQLFINDYWKLAMECGAYGVHLGHEDLSILSYDEINQLVNSDMRLGLSTHDYFELAYALSVRPSYVALGPIYPTTSKVMRFGPQGIEKLKKWQSLTDIPLVAIGGITLDNIQDVIDCDVNGIAAISMITNAQDPDKVVDKLQAQFKFTCDA
ncbi:bifunctional hydroxymethylpyrimidine kinase/phosphomethylpyrimidine kinase [Thiotrichales bacterium 19X7-9]|nr:bifunctional hydroxymethylpyrimidine kinase/phosphomethylpyrimidine kinase [Thiotrichales bacterium 19X7-9]